MPKLLAELIASNTQETEIRTSMKYVSWHFVVCKKTKIARRIEKKNMPLYKCFDIRLKNTSKESKKILKIFPQVPYKVFHIAVFCGINAL